MFDAKPFASAGSGGQRGRPRSSSAYRSGSAGDLGPYARALLAARRYQSNRKPYEGQRTPVFTSIMSGAEVSSLRGMINAEKRFPGEGRFFDPAEDS